MFNEDFDSNFDDTTTDTDTGDLTLDEINSLGLHPDLAAVADEFAARLQNVDNWTAKKALDELLGRAMLRGLEVGYTAGRFGVSVAMRF